MESQTNHTGSVINAAGKNRVLTSQVHVELHHTMSTDPSYAIMVFETLEVLEDNILVLKHGGQMDEVMIYPLATRFDGDWDNVWNTFEVYKAKISSLIKEDALIENIEEIDQLSDTLVYLSDVLATKLSEDAEILVNQIITLQIALGVTNVLVHIFMIFLIWRILNQQARQRIETEKFATLGRFAAMIAHDMRNPLGAIRNSMLLIQGRSSDKAVSEETKRIDRAVKRMSHQIEGVLNYMRPLPIILEPASIREIIEKSVDNVQIPDTITATIPKEDVTIQCDAEKLEFVFTNIIMNAVQALNGERGHITVGLDDRQDAIVLSFENSGASIPEENMPKIFEPMFTTKMQGTGLGLTSCKNIIERYQGTITVSNDPVTFTIELPKNTDNDRVKENPSS